VALKKDWPQSPSSAFAEVILTLFDSMSKGILIELPYSGTSDFSETI
jgi:hypothetical protein